jgi:carbonic anhydrase/acetyltransferase-like protein (isoleucine patch superfamily)
MVDSLRSYKGVTPRLGQRVYVDPAATVIGDVTLGNDVSVWPGAVIRGDMHWIRVGNRSNVQDNAVLHITHPSDYNPGGWPLAIGDDVVVGHRAILHGCTVGDRVLIGNGAIVNDGAVIEDEVIIGAGCVIPPEKTIASGFVYVGNPYRQLREVTEQEREFFRYSPANYVKLKDEYLADQVQVDGPPDC